VNVVRTAAELRAILGAARTEGRLIGFVPTMGALHAGHISLLDAARAESEVVILSIFVNPLQFGPTEDLAAYPRDETADIAVAERAGVDVVFLPTVDEMYPAGRDTTVTVGHIGTIVEGAERPGHFDGVATVVAKLFGLVEPDVSYFGQKDAQQVAVIKQLVRDLSFRTRISVQPTVREPDGLALSSRNAYLSPDERSRATALHRALTEGARTLREEDVGGAEKNMWELLVAGGLEPGYARVVDPDTFGPPGSTGEALLVIAARLGTTRLIDNMLVAQTEE
jgi:pantoate--beta-alanine ligase